MKIRLIMPILVALACILPIGTRASAPPASTLSLKKEIADLLSHRHLHFLKNQVEKVRVEFLINARNELVILRVEGENDTTCAKIRDILGFQKVGYRQPRQLIRYTAELRLVRNIDFSA